MTKGWDSGRYHDNRTGDEIRFLEGLGGHAPRFEGRDRERLLLGYRRSMLWRSAWGHVDQWKILQYLEEVKNGK